MPELLFSSVGSTEADRQLLESAIERSPALKKMCTQAQELYLGLTPRIEALEKEKYKVVMEVTELAEGLMTGRLPKEVHRERFIALKRRLSVLEASLRRAESLRRRLEGIPFVAVVRRAPSSEVAGRLSAPAAPGIAPALSEGAARASAPLALPPGSAMRPPPGAGEDWKRIRKFRVLKAETTLRQKEESLKRMEEDLQRSGGVNTEAVQALASNSDRIARAIARGGPDALKSEIEKIINEQRAAEAARAETKVPGLPGGPSAPVPPMPAGTGGARSTGKTCPLCAEPLTGKETTCPGCQADLQTLEAAKEGSSGPNAGEKFFRGGGATKLGVVLLMAAAATYLSWFLLR